MFQKIPVELPKSLSHKEKLQSLMHYIGGGWYKTIEWEASTAKKSKLSKKLQENEY